MAEKEGISCSAWQVRSTIPTEGETFTLLASGYEAFARYNRDLSPD